MMTTKFMDFDLEEHRRSVAKLLEEGGGTKGYIGHVTLGPAILEARTPGTRIVKVQSGPSRLSPSSVDASAETSYMARRSMERRPSPYNMAADEAGVLLDKIHRHHLHALAAMDKQIVGRHARGMVFAGYAYGMLGDPVCNIIANALWYDFTFPPSSYENQVRMLSSKAILRMACRSRQALFAFMRYYAPNLTDQQILRCLIETDGNLQLAVRRISGSDIGSERQVGAFRAAILAVGLPNGAVQQAHLSFVTNYGPALKLLLCNRRLFHPSILRPLGWTGPFGLPDEQHTVHGLVGESTSRPMSLSPSAYRALRLKMHSFRMEEELSLAIVHMALHKLALQLGERYELHMICGKNCVILPPQSYYHINFLASPEGSSNLPTLFFAEVRSTLKDVNDVTLCCPVTENNGRCFVCDCNGVKLLHPVPEYFNGVEDPIGDHLLTTDPTLEFGAPLNEDYIFFELDKHSEIAAFLEAKYSQLNDDQVDLSFMWFQNYLP